MYEDIILVLRDSWGEGKFKFWAQKNFVLVKIGDANVIYNKGKGSRPVVTYEELYVKLNECHKRVGHHGRDKTWSEIKSQYSWIPYDVVIMFIKLCDACSNRQIFTKFPASKPIVSIGYLTRVQIHLIDMRCRPDGEYKWILHAKDHFSKFSRTYPLRTKEAEPVAEKLLEQFYSFGPPRILQSDNGKEFVAKGIKDLKNTWVDLVIINARARHPETQGLIERGNQTLEVALGKWLKGLGPVTHGINTSTTHTTKKTPYEVVFGQLPRSDFEMWKKLSVQSTNSPITTGVTHNPSRDCLTNNSHSNDETPQLQPPETDSCSVSTAASSALNAIVATVCCESIHSHSDSDSYGTVEDVCCVINENGTQVPDTNIDENKHKRIRAAAEADYMKAIAKRQKIYDKAMKQK
ncbi:unnamed protein product [Adineta ricciae]|uniref:Integrase catalytic domain-containing protein n=1 Tax=Adineta ricciae TaxID=249248 RepID=A0A815JWM4_ADIRI|nr:unnamed protein product [Adineta ricciae]